MLYDTVFSKALEWPTLTTQWFPDVRIDADPVHQFHRLLYGTNTGGEASEYIIISELKIPSFVADPKTYNAERGELGGYGSKEGEMKFEVKQKIRHPGEVNKARYQWQNPDIIATMASDGRCLIWDRTKHPNMPAGDKSTPQMELVGHKDEGYGLHWNPHVAGQLATASNDNTIKLWDLKSYAHSKGTARISAIRTFDDHTAAVNDVEWNPASASIMASVSDDHSLKILDVREEKPSVWRQTKHAHKSEVTCVAWNPARCMLLATGSEDQSIAIWDIRKIDTKVNTLECHRAAVSKVQWHPSPNHHHIIASSSKDRRVVFWDLSKTGKEQSVEDAEDGQVELLFMHGGHTNHISDFDMNKAIPWMTFSAADDNLVQIWRPTATIVGKEADQEVPTEELDQR